MKVHGSLTALITHHSIMPELLPVTLNIHRHNPSFSDSEQDYASLQDFTQLMEDMKLTGQKLNPLEEDAYQWGQFIIISLNVDDNWSRVSSTIR